MPDIAPKICNHANDPLQDMTQWQYVCHFECNICAKELFFPFSFPFRLVHSKYTSRETPARFFFCGELADSGSTIWLAVQRLLAARPGRRIWAPLVTLSIDQGTYFRLYSSVTLPGPERVQHQIGPPWGLALRELLLLLKASNTRYNCMF